MTQLLKGLGDGISFLRFLQGMANASSIHQVVGRHAKTINSRMHRITNTTLVLKYLESKYNVRVMGCCAEDIVDQKEKSVLALIWRLVQRLCFEPTQMTLQSMEGSTFRRKIFSWTNAKVQDTYSLSVESWSDFQDGLLFCALLHLLDPSAFEYDVYRHKTPKERLKYSFSTAEEIHHVPALISPLYVLSDASRSGGLDDRSMTMYLCLWVNAFQERAEGEAKKSPRSSRVLAKMRARKNPEPVASEKVTVTVPPKASPEPERKKRPKSASRRSSQRISRSNKSSTQMSELSESLHALEKAQRALKEAEKKQAEAEAALDAEKTAHDKTKSAYKASKEEVKRLLKAEEAWKESEKAWQEQQKKWNKRMKKAKASAASSVSLQEQLEEAQARIVILEEATPRANGSPSLNLDQVEDDTAQRTIVKASSRTTKRSLGTDTKLMMSNVELCRFVLEDAFGVVSNLVRVDAMKFEDQWDKEMFIGEYLKHYDPAMVQLLQAMVRGWLSRRTSKHSLARHTAEDIIRTHVKAFLLRKQAQQACFLQKVRIHHLDQVVKAQAIVRGYIQRSHFRSHLSRKEHVNALLQAERAYLNAMKRTVSLYLNPLRQGDPDVPKVEGGLRKTIFSEYEVILNLNQSLLCKPLQERLQKGWHCESVVADILQSWMDGCRVYPQYGSKFSESALALFKLEKEESPIHLHFAAVTAAHDETSDHSLSYFLQLPLVRMTRIVDEVSHIMDETPPMHPDFDVLSVVYAELASLSDAMKMRLQEAENMKRVYTVQQTISGKVPAHLVARHRAWLMEGPLVEQKGNSKRPLYCYLLSDMLILCKRNQKYVARYLLSAASTTVRKEKGLLFHLNTREFHSTFTVPNKKALKDWIKAFAKIE